MTGGDRKSRPPLVLAEGLDLTFYSSASDLELDIEPTDVRNGEYRAYDASGRQLTLGTEQRSRETLLGHSTITVEHAAITQCEPEPSHEPELRASLLDFLDAIGARVETAQRTGPIEELVEQAARLSE